MTLDAGAPIPAGDRVGAMAVGSGASPLERAVIALRGMAHEHRLSILLLLQEGEQTPAALAEAIPAEPAAIAHHLRYLRDAQLVHRRRRGRQVYYVLRDEATRRLVGEVVRFALKPH